MKILVFGLVPADFTRLHAWFAAFAPDVAVTAGDPSSLSKDADAAVVFLGAAPSPETIQNPLWSDWRHPLVIVDQASSSPAMRAWYEDLATRAAVLVTTDLDGVTALVHGLARRLAGLLRHDPVTWQIAAINQTTAVPLARTVAEQTRGAVHNNPYGPQGQADFGDVLIAHSGLDSMPAEGAVTALMGHASVRVEYRSIDSTGTNAMTLWRCLRWLGPRAAGLYDLAEAMDTPV
jgi:hypothetical protein